VVINVSQSHHAKGERPFFLLESRLSKKPARLYHSPIGSVVAHSAHEIIPALETIADWQAAGDHAVGMMHYEAASAFSDLPVVPSDEPLLVFYRFTDCDFLTDDEVDAWLALQEDPKGKSCTISHCHLRCDRTSYGEAFQKVQEAIARGDTYQVNLTSAYTWGYKGDDIAWYRLLREVQPVDYSALLAFPEHTVLSLSPELFYEKRGTRLMTRPMKGTSKRSEDPKEDERLRAALQHCEKNRAENVMIVDLMRNDLNRVSETGSVSVEGLCAIEAYPTVYQMVTTVSSTVSKNTTLSELMQALFPSGSITGAPKRRTMQCIQELEQAPRGVYTGAIGYVTPDNDQCFNIPIRTLCLRNGRGHLGVGGGLVHQSIGDQEFDEMTLKADFFMKAMT